MSNVKFWLNVPDLSTFEVSVSGTNPNFDVAVDIDSDKGQEAEWAQADVVPGPARFTLHAPYRYTARVDVEVAGTPPAAVTFSAQVKAPNGTTVGVPFQFSTPAQPGTYFATIGIVTAGKNC